MSEIKFDYSIRSSPLAHPDSPATLGPKFLDTLDALSRIDRDIFTNWTILELPDVDALLLKAERSGAAAAVEKIVTFSLEAARSRIATIVENNVTRDDLRQPALTYGYSLVVYTATPPNRAA